MIGSFAEAIASIIVPLPLYTFSSMDSMGDEMRDAWAMHNGIREKIGYISPSENFRNSNNVILDPYLDRGEGEHTFGKEIKHTVIQSMEMVWSNIVAILVTFILFFISSYVMFLKQDIS